MQIAFYILLALIVIAAFIFGPRLAHDIQKKKAFTNVYALQNAANGKCLRIYNAGIQDGTPLIIYPHHNWECMTWQVIGLKDGTCLLKNLYTQKTFAPQAPEANAACLQVNLGESEYCYWVLEQDSNSVRLRLQGTDLYLTAMSDETDSRPVLQPRQDRDTQRWILLPQNPIV